MYVYIVSATTLVVRPRALFNDVIVKKCLTQTHKKYLECDDDDDVSGASSGDIEELSPQEIAALEREIADLEASLNNSDSTLEYSPDKSSDSGESYGGTD